MNINKEFKDIIIQLFKKLGVDVSIIINSRYIKIKNKYKIAIFKNPRLVTNNKIERIKKLALLIRASLFYAYKISCRDGIENIETQIIYNNKKERYILNVLFNGKVIKRIEYDNSN